MSPALKHQIGGPEGFYLGQLLWQTDTYIKFKRNFYLYSSSINIYDTFKGLNNPSSSEIPHVRSDIQDYLTEGKNNIKECNCNIWYSLQRCIHKIRPRVLEEMFGGIGGEYITDHLIKNIN